MLSHGGLGFRHFYGFNLAMLGKYGWNLLTNHDTILSKVLKAKYYPKTGFLEATLGHNPSYVWRSIHASQVVVRRGLKWSIGDGSKINVWHFPWLRDEDNPYITSSIMAGYEGMLVSELLQPNEMQWNEALIHQLFNLIDASEILKIPVSCTRNEDVPVWRFSNNGIYSVRSAYYQLMEVITDNTHLKVEGGWMKMWKLRVPNRVKIFIWRTFCGCLPVRERLLQKGVNCEPKCPCCASVTENEWHCFFGCDAVQEVWRQMSEWETMEQHTQHAQGYVELIFTLLQELDTFEVTRRAREALDDWIRVRRQPDQINSNANDVMQQWWIKPQQGGFKCNVDAACYVAENRYSIGACVRDDAGRFVKAMTSHFVGTPEVQEGEVQGLLVTLKWLQQLQINGIEIEMNCLNVVQHLAKKIVNYTDFGSIIEKCKNVLNLIQNCKVNYVRRQANRVTQELAQVARSYASHYVFEYCPPCIEVIVMNEMH
ncbi:retrotransposon protein [Trifolium medium]|uniref:Retrotransposon protein n=1 Tax=Trifolium medium TaxID=97028 RepID=A0A392LX74_9FABA|nr:retrotransposon protein [Trifolium medium]